jgi:hypothetical protein
MKRRLRFNKFGLAEDPRGGHCAYTYNGHELLGEVVGVVRTDGYVNRLLLDVRFMNGEPWPVQPMAVNVEMLVREYDA